MGNQIRITDKDGRHIATGNHGLGCCFYVGTLCQKYVPEFDMFHPDKIQRWLEIIHQEATPEDSLVIKTLLHDRTKLSSSDKQTLKNAIAAYPRHDQNGLRNQGPKRVLEKYLELLEEHGEITLEYFGVFVAMTVTGAVAK